MKSGLLLTLLVASSALSADAPKVAFPSHFILIPDADDRPLEKKAAKYQDTVYLRERVKTLERAVRQLQEEVAWLRYSNPSKNPGTYDRPTQTWFCAAKSSFDRMYAGKGSTQLEARVNAVNACKKEESLHCSEKSVTCEKEAQ